MTTRQIILACLIFITNLTIAQQKVAIYITGGNDASINKVLGDKLVEAFVKSGKYTAIERTSSFLNELGKEHDYQRTGNVKDDEISRLGRQFGVQLVCVAEVSEVFSEKYVSARLIDVESAEVISTSNSGSASFKSMSDLIAISDKLSLELSGKTGKEQYAEEQQRMIQTQEAAKAVEELRIKQKQQEELGKAISNVAYGVSTLLGGTIILENHDKDPFDVYLNDKLIATISGNSTLQHQVPKGNYTIKVVEKSGFILYQQVETFNIKISKGNTQTCRWE